MNTYRSSRSAIGSSLYNFSIYRHRRSKRTKMRVQLIFAIPPKGSPSASSLALASSGQHFQVPIPLISRALVGITAGPFNGAMGCGLNSILHREGPRMRGKVTRPGRNEAGRSMYTGIDPRARSTENYRYSVSVWLSRHCSSGSRSLCRSFIAIIENTQNNRDMMSKRSVQSSLVMSARRVKKVKKEALCLGIEPSAGASSVDS